MRAKRAVCAAGAAVGQEDITSKFKDAEFRAKVYKKIGKIAPVPIFDIDVRDITSLDVVRYGASNDSGISDLSGIEYFTALAKLSCTSNQLTALDVSKNTALTELRCEYNQLTALDLSKNTALTYLSCGNNQLTTLDVSKNTALTNLGCDHNQLTTLDLSKNTALGPGDFTIMSYVLSCGDQYRFGYIFDAWYRDVAYTSKWNNEISTNLILYAKWTYNAVTDITDVPNAIKINEQFPLTGTVIPENAAKNTIVWSVENAGTTGAGVYNGVFFAMSEGPVVLKATIADGKDVGVPYEQFFFINAVAVSVASPDRVIPSARPAEVTSISPVTPLTAVFTAGPNPASKSSGAVTFFRNGSRVSYATLSIYDASGSFVKKIRVIDDAVGSQTMRKVSSWDLRDNNGRLVSDGTYLVRGVVKAKGGKQERVSVIVGVR
jgi:uncharacterized repeat protein (TIGR02543 family)